MQTCLARGRVGVSNKKWQHGVQTTGETPDFASFLSFSLSLLEDTHEIDGSVILKKNIGLPVNFKVAGSVLKVWR